MDKDTSASSSSHHRKRSDSDSGRVHFAPAQVTPEHAGEIQVNVSADGTSADAHIGFLQLGRRYHIQFNLPLFLGSTVAIKQKHPDVSLVDIKALPDHSGHSVLIELVTTHDRLLEESVVLTRENGEPFKLVILAKVLGKGKGTPMLKSSIHCIAIENADSDLDSQEAAPLRKYSLHAKMANLKE